MKHLVLLLTAGGLHASATPVECAGQVSWFAGAGPAVPTGEFGTTEPGDFTGIGWQATGGIEVDVGRSAFTVGARGFYAVFAYADDSVNDHTAKLLGGTFVGAVALADGSAVVPILFAEAGLVRNAFTDDYSGPGGPARFQETTVSGVIGAGLGLRIPLRRLSALLTLGLIDSLRPYDYTQFVPLSAGVRISL